VLRRVLVCVTCFDAVVAGYIFCLYGAALGKV